MKQIDHMGRVSAGEKSHRFIRCVEVLVGNIERYRKDRSRAPLESLLGVFFEPHGGRTAAFVNVDERFK